MATTPVSDRVKKHRASKKVTAKGLAEMRAANRLYAERSRRKKTILRLEEERERRKNLFDAVDRRDFETESLAFSVPMTARKMTKRPNACEDELRNVRVRVLKHDIKMLKAMARERGDDNGSTTTTTRAPARAAESDECSESAKEVVAEVVADLVNEAPNHIKEQLKAMTRETIAEERGIGEASGRLPMKSSLGGEDKSFVSAREFVALRTLYLASLEML